MVDEKEKDYNTEDLDDNNIQNEDIQNDNRQTDEEVEDWKSKYERTLAEQENIKTELEMLKSMLSQQPTKYEPEQPAEPELDDSAKMYLEDEAFKKAMDYLLEQKLREKIAPIQQQVQPLSVMTEQMMLEQKRNELRRRHPDMDDIIHTESFKKYLQTLPAGLVAMGEYDVDVADKILRDYKRDKNITTENATKPFSEPERKGKGRKRIFRRSELIKMFKENPDEYRRLQPEIIKAYQEGRVTPD